jgi:hypothetical protein
MQRLKNKLNFTESIAVIYMVIKKKYLDEGQMKG